MQRITFMAALATFGVLALAGAAMYAWLLSRGSEPPFHVRVYWAILCATPAVVLFPAIAIWEVGDPVGFAVRCFVCLMFLPAFLLWWGLEEAPSPQAVVEVSAAGAPSRLEDRTDTLDADALFSGSVAGSETTTQYPGLQAIRSASFADGTQVELWRFANTQAASGYREFMASTQGARPVTEGGRTLLQLMPDAPNMLVKMVLEQHGADLVKVTGTDLPSIAAWLNARGVPPPGAMPSAPKDLPRATSPARGSWKFGIAWCVVQVVLLLAIVVWLGVATTTVPPAKGVAPASETTLRARLDSLDDLGLALAFRKGARAGDVVAEFRYGGGEKRARRYTMRLDAGARIVRVREVSGVYGDAPRTAEEASMRPIGASPLDSRPYPDADRIWDVQIAATPVRAEQLAAIPLTLAGPEASWPRGVPKDLEPDALGHALAAVVTRSGWTWQPVFFWFQG